LAVALLCSCGAAQAAFPGANGRIAFATDRDGNSEIYTMNPDGSSLTRLTNNAAFDGEPAWSPDGTKIVFTTNRDGNLEIYAMNADGTSPTRLTNNAAFDAEPAWSPDGTKIAFDTDRDGNTEIYTMNADGTSPARLTNNAAIDESPGWSPTGTKIVFDTSRDGNNEVYTMNADGTTQTRLTNSPGIDQSPNWQPVFRNYARPRGATPTRISLVPAYKPCTSPNTAHKAPISLPSCNPPRAESGYLTVGTPDFNGAGANAVGSMLFKALPTTPGDISIDVSLTDVRCVGTSGGCTNGALADYTDDLLFDTTFRVTDKGNGGANPSGTVSDLPLRFSVPCTTTASTTVGSTCAISTSVNSLLGSSAIVNGQREIWQLSGDEKIYDGGADGVATTRGDNTLFAAGGIFTP
jgi:hypothetical protein